MRQVSDFKSQSISIEFGANQTDMNDTGLQLGCVWIRSLIPRIEDTNPVIGLRSHTLSRYRGALRIESHSEWETDTDSNWFKDPKKIHERRKRRLDTLIRWTPLNFPSSSVRSFRSCSQTLLKELSSHGLSFGVSSVREMGRSNSVSWRKTRGEGEKRERKRSTEEKKQVSYEVLKTASTFYFWELTWAGVTNSVTL